MHDMSYVDLDQKQKCSLWDEQRESNLSFSCENQPRSHYATFRHTTCVYQKLVILYMYRPWKKVHVRSQFDTHKNMIDHVESRVKVRRVKTRGKTHVRK